MKALDRRVLVAGIALLAAGFFFRAWAVGHARFTGDESWFWATARNIATFQAAPIYGPSMTGSGANHPGPIFYYLMALPQRLGPSPWWGGLFVALLHVGSSALLGLLALRARGPRAGLVALALVAFAPWDVLYADRIWLSCVAPVWGAAILYAATRLDEPRMQGALLFFAATCPQLHMSAPIVWAAALALAWGTPRPLRLAWRPLALGALLVLAAYALPLWNELTHQFVNTRAILSEGGGKEPLDVVLVTPLKVLGYAMLSATAEIGYHFETGYWRTFKDGEAYFTARGVAAWWARHGALWASLTLLTVLVSMASWIYAALRLVAAVRARRSSARTTGAPAALGLDDRVTLALAVGLVAAMALMMAAKKPFFPHYTNLLMPLLLWPVIIALDALLARAAAARELGLGRGVITRGLVFLTLGLVTVAMASASARYYLEVDRRNGLDATAAMVETVMTGPTPVEVHFDGFYNRFAWEMLASTGYRRSLPLGAPAARRYYVRNARIHDGAPLTPDATVQDGVVMEAR